MFFNFWFLPRAFERRVFFYSGGLLYLFISSHPTTFTSSHLIFTSSHHLFFPSSPFLLFASSHLHIFTSAHLLFESRSLSLSCSLFLFSSCPLIRLNLLEPSSSWLQNMLGYPSTCRVVQSFGFSFSRPRSWMEHSPRPGMICPTFPSLRWTPIHAAATLAFWNIALMPLKSRARLAKPFPQWICWSCVTSVVLKIRLMNRILPPHVSCKMCDSFSIPFTTWHVWPVELRPGLLKAFLLLVHQCKLNHQKLMIRLWFHVTGKVTASTKLSAEWQSRD